MKILIFGGSGQLGYDLRRRSDALNIEIIAPISSEINISDREQVNYLIKAVRPSIIVNSAAYTQVDDAEKNRELAFAVNCNGPKYIAEASKDIGARLIHISTDYVFDGSLGRAITERDQTNPLNVYGESKLAGEIAVQEILPVQSLILRTSWLHGSKGKNFVQTMIKLFQEKKELKVVNDQFGSPTWTGWLAEVILDLSRIDCSGVIHTTCRGSTSWYDFSVEILNQIRDELPGFVDVQILPQSSKESVRPAVRPRHSVLDCTRLSEVLGREPILWQDGLTAHLKELGYFK
ncbi:MAG: dTDP-4-dehydrorhamnose reductase [bacterium]|nr:dTDP-4-dehydrorhamnose reductase [bacterium]